MSRMQHAVDCLARSTSPFLDLVPALSGYVLAKRVFMDAEEALSDDDRRTGNFFFEVMLEILDEKLSAAYEGLDIRVADVLKLAHEGDANAWPQASYQTLTFPKSVMDRLCERFILQNVEQQQCGAPFSLH